MAANEPVTRIGPDDRRVGDPTPNMVREEAIGVEGMWAGFVRTAPHMTSGWHHHGDHDTAVYVIDGALRMEYGTDGREVLDAGPGDFVHVPKHTIHRESNPLDRESHAIVVRSGDGPPTLNVDGPERD
jgi:uncharacterized RmlC-like cupin family protein